MSDRRQFLRSGSLALAAALASCGRPEQPSGSTAPGTPSTPGAPPAFNTGPVVGPPVTPETFAEACKLTQIEMTDAERRMAAGSWRTSMAPLLERRTGPRKITLDPTVAPATQWSPWLIDAPAATAGAESRDRFVRASTDPGSLPSSER